MAGKVVRIRYPRWVTITGLVSTVVLVVLAAARGSVWPLLIAMVTLLFGSGPLLVRLDEVRLNGPYLSVRKGFWWVGPIDLRNLVALGFAAHSAAHQTPAVWCLVQRDAGRKVRRWLPLPFEPPVRDRLDAMEGLRYVWVGAGNRWAKMPKVTDHLAYYSVGRDVLVDQEAFARMREGP